MIKKPNSLCKNINCRKPFYSCAFCTHTISWRAIACCPECYDAYTKQVNEARAANRKVNLLPERTDMTEEQVKELLAKPTEEVIEVTKDELSEYSNELATIGLGETIDKINDDIREAQDEDAKNTPFLSNGGRGNRNKRK